MYAIETSLLKGVVLKAARGLAGAARMSPRRDVTLVDRSTKYAHCDPIYDEPARNDFLQDGRAVPQATRG